MIKIKKEDSILDIINKINDTKGKSIVLNIPFWHPVLHDYLSLKIIKNKFSKREIIIITSDFKSRWIWKKLWIKYSIIKDDSFYKKENILKHNFTFFEYFKFLLSKYYKDFKDFIFLNKKINSLKKYSWLNKQQKSWIGLFLLTFIVSIFIFFFIFYFAVNKTYVYIKPEVEVRNKSMNLVFLENADNSFVNMDNIINLKEVNKIVQLEETFTTSWVDESEIRKSSWKAIIYNNYPEVVNLKPNTRFQSQDWLLFEIEDWIKIPEATIWEDWKIISWKVEADLISKTKDANWKVMWSRWNIWENIKLILPWLEDWDDKIYWETSSIFTWWEDYKKSILTKQDLDNAKAIMWEKLKQEAIYNVKTYLDEENKNNNITQEILSEYDSIKYSRLDISPVWDISVWDEIKDFKLIWSIDIKLYVYNKESVLNELRQEIDAHTIKETEKVLYINDKSIRFSNLFYKNTNPFELKSTVEIEYFLTQNFLNEDNSYVQRLKISILWMNIDEATKILLNNPKISNAEIDAKPFFIKNVSNIWNNIEIKVIEE